MKKESQSSLLRTQYRQNIHQHWNNENSIKYPDLVRLKNEILQIESNGSKKFYVYKRFVDWGSKRFESEISDIQNKEITMVHPSAFNDPYDCRMSSIRALGYLKEQRSDPKKFTKSIHIMISKEESTKNLPRPERRRMGKSILEKQIRRTELHDAEKLVEDLKKSFRVACFSTNPSDMYFWSHYGGAHRGYCIEYEFGDGMFEYLHPVEYVDKIPSFEGLQSNKRSIALIKSSDWMQENEWRLIAINDANDKNYDNPIQKYKLGDAKISALYLGLDFNKKSDEISNSRREDLLKCFDDKSIFQMKIRDDEFKIMAERVN